MKEIFSLRDLYKNLGEAKLTVLLLTKDDSQNSACAFNNLSQVNEMDKVKVLYANVSEVRDIHPVFSVTSVPTLLVFEDRELKNVVKACQTVDYYKNILQKSFFVASSNDEGKPAKRVTVYSTPTCSWCNTLKTWLDNNGVRYSDIDISRDQNAAQELVRRTGQQGVPQTDVNGRIVVGFDQNKLKELLEL